MCDHVTRFTLFSTFRCVQEYEEFTKGNVKKAVLVDNAECITHKQARKYLRSCNVAFVDKVLQLFLWTNLLEYYKWLVVSCYAIGDHIWYYRLTLKEMKQLTFKSLYKGGGGCGRFWNLPILVICSLHKRLSRISFCMVRDKCMLLILLKRNFCLIFKIAAKSPKTANFDALTISNVFLNSNCF